MAAPLEIRMFNPLFTLRDAEAGIQPIRFNVLGPNGSARVILYAPPRIQYRWRERAGAAKEGAYQWSEWVEAPFVREGQDEANEPNA